LARSLNNNFEFTVNRCNQNQQYDECVSPCESKCEDIMVNHRRELVCKAPCKPGCKCANGYVFNFKGECVSLKSCQPKGNYSVLEISTK